MRELFERLRDGGEAAVHDLRTDRFEESLYVDFKLKGNASSGSFSSDDKRLYAKALSGFSNSDGGLLVFGVDCRAGDDGVDCVQGFAPIADIDRFASDARNMLASLLSPRNNGVEISVVSSSLHINTGYLLVWIPRSERRPHQSRAANEFKYYKRNGRDFHAMEHYEVEDAFRTQTSPELEIEASERGFATAYAFEGTRHQIVAIKLKNTSKHIAKFPFIQIDSMRKLSAFQSNLNPSNLLLEQDLGLLKFYAGQDFVIHPNQSRIMAQVVCEVQRIDGVWLCDGRPVSGEEISFGYTYGCENAPAASGRFVLPMSSLLP